MEFKFEFCFELFIFFLILLVEVGDVINIFYSVVE